MVMENGIPIPDTQLLPRLAMDGPAVLGVSGLLGGNPTRSSMGRPCEVPGLAEGHSGLPYPASSQFLVTVCGSFHRGLASGKNHTLLTPIVGDACDEVKVGFVQNPLNLDTASNRQYIQRFRVSCGISSLLSTPTIIVDLGCSQFRATGWKQGWVGKH